MGWGENDVGVGWGENDVVTTVELEKGMMVGWCGVGMIL